MRLFRQTFDFVFSIGEDCACASYLNWHRLRVESSPFDWLTRASFATRTGLLENGFAEFLRCENMRQIPKPTEGYRDEKCDYYADDATDFYFYHDFPAGIALNASFPAVKEKYQRRISRLLGRLASSREVLMVWWSRDKRLSDAELLDALDRLQRRYPNVRLSLLAFEQSDNVRRVIDEIGRQLSAKGLRLTVVVPPLRVDFREELHRSAIDWRLILRPFAGKVSVLDYQDDADFGRGHFCDMDHLNERGARLLASKVRAALAAEGACR